MTSILIHARSRSAISRKLCPASSGCARRVVATLCALACLLGATTAWTQVRATPAPSFDPAPLTGPGAPVSPAMPPAAGTGTNPPQAPSPRTELNPPAPLRNSGSVNRPPLRVQGADNPALDAEVARLRAAALAPVPAGARLNRSAANASWVMGLLHVHGIGVVVNLTDAAVWFERAYALGEPLAAAGLAWCEIEGCKTSPNPGEARRWLSALRVVNLPRAQYLQWLLESRLSPLEIATPGGNIALSAAASAAKALLVSAAEAGDVQARIELGFDSLSGNRDAEALKQFRAAAPQSAVAAANAAQLVDAARKPATGAASGNAADTLALAQRNHRGDGQPANFVEAIRLYRLAQSQGSAQARKMLEQIFSRPGPDGQIDVAWMQQLAYANFSSDVATLGSAVERQSLRREATPLFDLLPANWKRYRTQPGPR